MWKNKNVLIGTLHEINICCIDLVLNSYIIASSFIVLRSYRCKHNSIKIKIDEKLDFEACWKDLWNKVNNEVLKFILSSYSISDFEIARIITAERDAIDYNLSDIYHKMAVPSPSPSLDHILLLMAQTAHIPNHIHTLHHSVHNQMILFVLYYLLALLAVHTLKII